MTTMSETGERRSSGGGEDPARRSELRARRTLRVRACTDYVEAFQRFPQGVERAARGIAEIDDLMAVLRADRADLEAALVAAAPQDASEVDAGGGLVVKLSTARKWSIDTEAFIAGRDLLLADGSLTREQKRALKDVVTKPKMPAPRVYKKSVDALSRLSIPGVAGLIAETVEYQELERSVSVVLAEGDEADGGAA